MNFDNEYTAPTLTVDAVIFQLVSDRLEVLLIKRSNEPFKGAWALPGGYSAAGDTTLESLSKITASKAGVDINKLGFLEQLYTFDTVARDPRGHAVSVVYMACGRDIKPADNSESATFYPVDDLPELAYDHQKIIEYARERLDAKLSYTNAVYGLLPEYFTLTDLQKAYEAVLGRELDKRNFRKKFLSLGLITQTSQMKKDGAHRPARLYEFNSKTLESLTRSFD